MVGRQAAGLTVREEQSGECTNCILHSKYRSLAEGEWAVVAAGRRLQLSNCKLSILLPADGGGDGDAQQPQLLLLPTEHGSITLGPDGLVGMGGGSGGASQAAPGGVDLDDMLLADFCTSFSELLQLPPAAPAQVLAEVSSVSRIPPGHGSGPGGSDLFEPAAVIELTELEGGGPGWPLWLHGRQMALALHVCAGDRIALQRPRLCCSQPPAGDSAVAATYRWLEYDDEAGILYTLGGGGKGSASTAPSLQGLAIDRPLRPAELCSGILVGQAGLLCQLRGSRLRRHAVAGAAEVADVGQSQRLMLYVEQPVAWGMPAGSDGPALMATVSVEWGADADTDGGGAAKQLEQLRPGQLLWISGLSASRLAPQCVIYQFASKF